MKIRTKFTLWISLSALSTALLASFFVYSELLEEPYKMIDRELFAVASTAIDDIDIAHPTQTNSRLEKLDYPGNKYWFKVFDRNSTEIFSSSLANLFDITIPLDTKKFFFSRQLSPTQLWIDPGDIDELDEITDDSVKFRAMVVERDTPAGHIVVVIAKPILFFDLELQELRVRLAWGICGTIALIFLSSCYLARRLLQPISTINQQVRQIREHSLNKRIPLGKSRDELHELSSSLNTMFDSLQHSFTRQKQFIGDAAHELKSPLTILMLGHEEMLAGNPPEMLRLELEKQLTTMRRLNRLVRDLLAISRLEQEEVCRRETVDLDLLVREVIDDYHDMLQARRITIDIDTSAKKIRGDSEKLLRLLINLIDNAIKYNQAKDGRITIMTEKVKGATILSISNTGTQIPTGDLPHVFDQFFRVEKSRSQAYGGSGLGLTIVQSIVELHGGNINVTGSNGWTTFTVRLPDMPEG